MRTLKQWLKNTSKNGIFIYLIFGVYFLGVLWLTLFNRKITYTHQVMMPFWSYRRVLIGDLTVLKEDVENILLFVPFGYLVKVLKDAKEKRIVFFGFLFSLTLETLQFVFTLGFFEIDDLFHNTVGVILGIVIFRLFPLRKILQDRMRARRVLLIIIGTLLVVFLGKTLLNYLNHQKMLRFATLGDTDKDKNLLVLNGNNGFAWNTDVYVEYMDDGRLHIYGSSDKKSWWPIAELKLEPGNYVLTGMDDVPENTVAIEVELFDKNQRDYFRYLPDLGPEKSICFQILESEEIRVCVTVYPDMQCDNYARPVIYRLGE